MLERRCLEQHRGGLFGDLGIETAHDTCQAHSTFRSGDNGHVAREVAFLAVEGRELLAVACSAHDDVRLAIRTDQFVIVERMQRLAVEEQDVVRDVNDVVDRARTSCRHTFSQPLRAGTDLDVLDDTRGIACATLGILDFDCSQLSCIGQAGIFLELVERQSDIFAIHRANFARHADHRQAIGTVRCDLEVEHRVGHLHVLRERHTNGRVFGQDHDAIMTVADAELTLGAVHATAGHTAQLRLLDREVARQRRAHHGCNDMVASIEVLRAADDLQRLRVSIGINIAGTHVDLGDPQMIGVGMRRLLEHLGSDDILERIADLVDAFNTRARQIEAIAERLEVGRHVNVLVKPLERNFHDYSPPLRTDAGSACRLAAANAGQGRCT